MSKKKGLSVEEKKSRMLDLFYEKKDFFQLKELEKIAPKEKGIIVQSVKDIVQNLVDDNLVDSEKIGTSVYFWAFPSKAVHQKKRKIEELNAKIDSTKTALVKTRDNINKAKEGREDTEERQSLLNENKRLKSEDKRLNDEIQKYKDSDPEVLEKMKHNILKKYTSSEEYFKDLNAWFDQTYYFWNLTAKFPHYLAQQQVAARINSQGVRQRVNVQANATAPTQGARQDANVDGIECRVPALWKRLVAEFIDFLILFFLKMAITLVVVDFFDFVDWDKFATDLFQGGDKIEYNTVVKMTQDLLILELVHRIVVCAFETYWLMTGREGRLGGATPGKSVMGLRVLICASIDDIPNNGINGPTILVKPGSDPGLQASFIRSLSKNLMLMFFFPATFFLYYFRHNRTAYDLFSGTVVVEEPLVHHRVRQN